MAGVLKKIFRRQDLVIFKDHPDGSIMVLDTRQGRFYLIDGVAAKLFRSFDGRLSIAKHIDGILMTRRFERVKLKKQVIAFVEALVKLSLIEESKPAIIELDI